MHKKRCAMSNLTAQTGFNKSNKLLHEIKLWAKMREIQQYDIIIKQYSRIPLSYRLNRIQIGWNNFNNNITQNGNN